MGFNTKKLQTSGGTPRKGMFPRNTFLSLDDTPDTYSAKANYVVSVKGDETGVEFKATGVIDDHLVLVIGTDTTPGSLVNKIVAGDNISFTTNNPTGDASITVALKSIVNIDGKLGMGCAPSTSWVTGVHPLEFHHTNSYVNTCFCQYENNFNILYNAVTTTSGVDKFLTDAPYGNYKVNIVDGTMNLFHGLAGLAGDIVNWRYWVYDAIGVWIWNPGYHFKSGQIGVYGRYTLDMVRFNIYPEYSQFNCAVGIYLIPSLKNDSIYIGSRIEGKSYTGYDDYQLINWGEKFSIAKNLYITDDPSAQTWKLKAASAAIRFDLSMETMEFWAQNIGGAADDTATLKLIFRASAVVGFSVNPNQTQTTGSFNVSGKNTAQLLTVNFNTEEILLGSVTRIKKATYPKIIFENLDVSYGSGDKVSGFEFQGYSGTSASTMAIIAISHSGTDDDYKSQLTIQLNSGAGTFYAFKITGAGTILYYSPPTINTSNTLLATIDTSTKEIGTFPLTELTEGHSFSYIVHDDTDHVFRKYSLN